MGDIVRDSATTAIMCGFGSGIREHYLQVMRIPEDQLLRGILGTLSHQSNANLPVHKPTDPKQIAQAIVCYKYPMNSVDFQVQTNNKVAAKQLITLFNRFHHGGKVRTQDVESMRNSVVEGQRQGRQMKALKELLLRISEHEAASQVMLT